MCLNYYSRENDLNFLRKESSKDVTFPFEKMMVKKTSMTNAKSIIIRNAMWNERIFTWGIFYIHMYVRSVYDGHYVMVRRAASQTFTSLICVKARQSVSIFFKLLYNFLFIYFSTTNFHDRCEQVSPMRHSSVNFHYLSWQV